MSVVTLPDQTPLSEGRELADGRRPVLDRAIEFGRERDVPVSGTIRIGHHAGDAILNTITQREADAVLLGWRGATDRGRNVVFGSSVDRVIRDADCDVYVEKIGAGMGEVDSILLPTAGGPHAAFAAETARTIAAVTGASLTVINVIDPGAPAEERERAEELLDRAAAELDDVEDAVETELVESSDVVEAIVAETGDYDLTIIGATREGLLQRILFGAIPEAVGQRAANTVIMTKRNLDVTSRLRSVFGWR